MAQGKKSATVDERYYRAAEEHLYSELAVALGIPMDEVECYIKERIGQMMDA